MSAWPHSLFYIHFILFPLMRLFTSCPDSLPTVRTVQSCLFLWRISVRCIHPPSHNFTFHHTRNLSPRNFRSPLAHNFFLLTYHDFSNISELLLPVLIHPKYHTSLAFPLSRWALVHLWRTEMSGSGLTLKSASRFRVLLRAGTVTR